MISTSEERYRNWNWFLGLTSYLNSDTSQAIFTWVSQKSLLALAIRTSFLAANICESTPPVACNNFLHHIGDRTHNDTRIWLKSMRILQHSRRSLFTFLIFRLMMGYFFIQIRNRRESVEFTWRLIQLWSQVAVVTGSLSEKFLQVAGNYEVEIVKISFEDIEV